MSEVVFLPAADLDYRTALDWYESRSPRAATGFETAVEISLRRIADAPDIWPRCDERHRIYLLRRYPYSIIYRKEQDFVLVVAIAHQQRSEAYWKGRE